MPYMNDEKLPNQAKSAFRLPKLGLTKSANDPLTAVTTSPNPRGAYEALPPADQKIVNDGWGEKLLAPMAAKDVMAGTGAALGGGLLAYALYKTLNRKKPAPAMPKFASILGDGDPIGGVIDAAGSVIGAGGKAIGGAIGAVGNAADTTAPRNTVWRNPSFTMAAGVGVPLAIMAAWNLRKRIQENSRKKINDSEMLQARRQFDQALSAERGLSKAANNSVVTSAAMLATTALLDELQSAFEKKAVDNPTDPGAFSWDTLKSMYYPLATLGALGTAIMTYQKLKKIDPDRIKAEASRAAMTRQRVLGDPAVEFTSLQPGESEKDVTGLSDNETVMVPFAPPRKKVKSQTLNMPSGALSKVAGLEKSAAEAGLTLDVIEQVWNEYFTPEVKFGLIVNGVRDNQDGFEKVADSFITDGLLDKSDEDAAIVNERLKPVNAQTPAGASTVDARAKAYAAALRDPENAAIVQSMVLPKIQASGQTLEGVLQHLDGVGTTHTMAKAIGRDTKAEAVNTFDGLLTQLDPKMKPIAEAMIKKHDPNYVNPAAGEQQMRGNLRHEGLKQSVEETEKLIQAGQQLPPERMAQHAKDKAELQQTQAGQDKMNNRSDTGNDPMSLMKGLLGKVVEWFGKLNGAQWAGLAGSLGAMAMGHPILGLIGMAASIFGKDILQFIQTNLMGAANSTGDPKQIAAAQQAMTKVEQSAAEATKTQAAQTGQPPQPAQPGQPVQAPQPGQPGTQAEMRTGSPVAKVPVDAIPDGQAPQPGVQSGVQPVAQTPVQPNDPLSIQPQPSAQVLAGNQTVGQTAQAAQVGMTIAPQPASEMGTPNQENDPIGKITQQGQVFTPDSGQSQNSNPRADVANLPHPAGQSPNDPAKMSTPLPAQPAVQQSVQPAPAAPQQKPSSIFDFNSGASGNPGSKYSEILGRAQSLSQKPLSTPLPPKPFDPTLGSELGKTMGSNPTASPASSGAAAKALAPPPKLPNSPSLAKITPSDLSKSPLKTV